MAESTYASKRELPADAPTDLQSPAGLALYDLDAGEDFILTASYALTAMVGASEAVTAEHPISGGCDMRTAEANSGEPVISARPRAVDAEQADSAGAEQTVQQVAEPQG